MIIRTTDGTEHVVGGPEGQGIIATLRGIGSMEKFFLWDDVEDCYSAGRWWRDSVDNWFRPGVDFQPTATKENL